MPILRPAFWTRSRINKRLYRTYVETGAYRGAGIREVLDEYEAIHSIELSRKWYDHCAREYANHSHVHLHFGDSTELLSRVLDEIDEPAVIFLDAHYSGGSTARRGRDTPLLAELEIVRRRSYPDIIVIDDTSFFGQKGGSEPAESASDDDVWPQFAYDWRDTTEEAVRARLKPGYALATNEDRLMTTSERVDQYILYPIQRTGSISHRSGGSAASVMKNVKFVVGIEDRVYLRWQLSILLESLHDKLPPGWEPWVVVCNGHQPLSADLRRVLDTYGVRHFTGANHPREQNMDFAGGGDVYVPINRIEALNVVAERVGDDDLVCLTETDVFLYGDLDPSVFPKGNALFDNWIVRQEVFFGHGGARETTGVRLPMLLEAMGVKKAFKPGGVTIFLDADTLRNKKVVKDAFRFAQVLYLLGTIVRVPKVWIAEMPAVALSLTANGIDFDLIDAPQFTTQNHDHETIPAGSFYHYYHDLRDGGDGAFRGSVWYKHKFMFENFLLHDFEPYQRETATDHEKVFFALAERTRRRAWRFTAPETIEARSRHLRERVRYYGRGFRKVALDPTLYDLLRRRLESNFDHLEEEPDDVSEYIRNVETGAPVTRFHQDAEFNRSLLLALKSTHEDWCGFPLIASACYGIRVYQRGTYLFEHTDTPETHIISSTICVGQETDCPWPLSIEDIDGKKHDVVIEPGEMLFYEGARLRHGRPYPLQGAYYAGIYLHYRPADDPAAGKRE